MDSADQGLDLKKAISQSKAGDVIPLKAGTYFLNGSVFIDWPVSLVGEGIGKTIIVVNPAGAESVFRLNANQIVFEGISFSGQDSLYSNCLSVSGGNVEILRCGFFRFAAGVQAGNEAEVRVEDGRFLGNRIGVSFTGHSSGTVVRSVLRENREGIVIRDRAHGVLEENRCEKGRTGIVFGGHAGGVAQNNVCSGNEKWGIAIVGNVSPTLEGNHCEGNSIGIAFGSGAGGTARHNVCTANRVCGVFMDRNAHPDLDANEWDDNGQEGGADALGIDVSVFSDENPGAPVRSGPGGGTFDLNAELKGIIGCDEVKEMLRSLFAELETDRRRRAKGLPAQKPGSLHMVFTGNPGTGKTTVARVVARMLKNTGILQRGHLVEVTRSDLVASYVGHTAPKVEAVVQKALGGVLFIDEAYSLTRKATNDFGTEAVDTLVKMMEEHREKFVVIAAGYEKEMREFFEANSGLRSRFPIQIHFPDYSVPELVEMGKAELLRRDFRLADGALSALENSISRQHIPGLPDTGNGRLVRNIIEAAKRRQSLRLAALGDQATVEDLQTMLPADIDSEIESFKAFDLEAELAELVGLDGVKDAIRSVYRQVLVQNRRREAGLHVQAGKSLHAVFYGNPGTGKTTVARLLASLLKDMKVLKRGHLVEVARHDLVGQYVGETALKAAKVITSAIGGVLFIDEAYSLSRGHGGGGMDYGLEAIDVLVKTMEDHRENLMVIVAGYRKEMEDFLGANPGLASRFSVYLDFPDFSPDELAQIARRDFVRRGFLLPTGTVTALPGLFQRMRTGGATGNGRLAGNLVDAVLSRQADRLVLDEAATGEALITIQPEDLPGGGRHG